MDLPHQQETEYLGITEAAEYLRISASTLRRWEKKGFLIPERTPTGIRRYTRQQLDDVLNNPQPMHHAEVDTPTTDTLVNEIQQNYQQQSEIVENVSTTFSQPEVVQEYTQTLVESHPMQDFTISSHRFTPSQPPETQSNQQNSNSTESSANTLSDRLALNNNIIESESLDTYISYTDDHSSAAHIQNSLNSLIQDVDLKEEPVIHSKEDETLSYPPPLNPPKYSSIFHDNSTMQNSSNKNNQISTAENLEDTSSITPTRQKSNMSAFAQLHTFQSPTPVVANNSQKFANDALPIRQNNETVPNNFVNVTAPNVEFSQPVFENESYVEDTDPEPKYISDEKHPREAAHHKHHSPFLPVLIYLGVFVGVFVIALGVWFVFQSIAGTGQSELIRPVIR